MALTFSRATSPTGYLRCGSEIRGDKIRASSRLKTRSTATLAPRSCQGDGTAFRDKDLGNLARRLRPMPKIRLMLLGTSFSGIRVLHGPGRLPRASP